MAVTVDSLRESVAAGRALVVFGTGVTASATGGAPSATWTGLIKDGIAYFADAVLPTDEAWVTMAKTLLQFAESRSDAESSVQAASMVAAALKAIGPQAYADWLANSIGSLSATDTSVLDAIGRLPVPLLTTNYDRLLESHLGRESATWLDERRIQQIIAGTAADVVGHLHGVFDQPDSVVLSSEDYSRLANSPAIAALEKGASGLKSIVYVGFGAGLGDPNFGQLISWHRQTFRVSGVEHYRLCIEGERSTLTAEHANDNIYPLAYGAAHSDLASFLIGLIPAKGTVMLSPAGLVRDVIAEAREHLAESVRADTIIGESLDDVGIKTLRELLVAPVLLPVPHAEFVRERAREAGADVNRVDLETILEGEDLILLVGDEGSGLSSAVKWLVDAQAERRAGSAPLFASFRSRTKGAKPLDRLVRGAASMQGIVASPKDALPRLVVGLDDLSPYGGKLSDAVISELATHSFESCVVGCKSGEEVELLERWRLLGVTPRVLYVGRYQRSDIERMAQIAAPARFQDVSGKVLEVLRAENLPFTPFTIALLISIVIRGGDVLATNASPTNLLDQYVGLLLGRGDPADDSRYSFDVVQREAILAHISGEFVMRRVASLSEAETIESLERFFSEFGWKESPVDVLADFARRRVLRTRGGRVSFARNAFLFLFAGKRALEDGALREMLIANPIDLGSAIKNYSALSRKDGELLKVLDDLLATFATPSEVAPAFQEVEPGFGVAALETLLSKDETESGKSASVVDEVEDDGEGEPFALTDPADVPDHVRFMVALDVASTALRDSDQVADLDFKREMLKHVLTAWGHFVAVVSNDFVLDEIIDSLLRAMPAEQPAPERAKLESFLEDLNRMVPAAVAMGGIAATLSSRRLLVVLERALEDDDFVGDVRGAISAVMLTYVIREPGWVATLEKLLHGREKLWVAHGFMAPLLYMTLRTQALEPDDARALSLLVAWLLTTGERFTNEATRKQAVDTYSKRLLQARRLYFSRDSGASELPA